MNKPKFNTVAINQPNADDAREAGESFFLDPSNGVFKLKKFEDVIGLCAFEWLGERLTCSLPGESDEQFDERNDQLGAAFREGIRASIRSLASEPDLTANDVIESELLSAIYALRGLLNLHINQYSGDPIDAEDFYSITRAVIERIGLRLEKARGETTEGPCGVFLPNGTVTQDDGRCL